MEYFDAPTIYGEQTDGGVFSESVYQGKQPACAGDIYIPDGIAEFGDYVFFVAAN